MIELLSNTGYIMVNKTLIKKIGLHEALMLGELCSEYSYWKSTVKLDEEGYFFSTRENIEENIGLSSFQQRKAITTTLKECNTYASSPLSRYCTPHTNNIEKVTEIVVE